MNPSAPSFCGGGPLQEDLRLPIPSPDVFFDRWLQGYVPWGRSPYEHWDGPDDERERYPLPIGSQTAEKFVVEGLYIHDFGYVNYHPEKLFTKHLWWFVEITDNLFRHVCPSDLNNLPCEWDELQNGCPMMRLCEMRHKYPHPHLGPLYACNPEFYNNCRSVHHIQPTCRSLARQAALRPEEDHHVQLCETIANGEICEFGHDLESARLEAVCRYWEHRNEARERGSIGYVQKDVFGRKLLRPIMPAYYYDNEDDDQYEEREVDVEDEKVEEAGVNIDE